MKRTTCLATILALLLALLVGILPATAETEDESAVGSAPLYEIKDGLATIDGKTYIAVTTAEELANMEIGKNYILANDIDCSNAEAKENGTYLFDFPGTNENLDMASGATILNGNGYSLMNVNLTSERRAVSIFNSADKKNMGGITIRDLNVGSADNHAKIVSTRDEGRDDAVFVGTLLAQVNASATLENIHVYADIKTAAAHAGGLIGGLRGGDNIGHAIVMNNCTFDGTITSENPENWNGWGSMGGMIGRNNSALIFLTMTNCVNNGTFTGGVANGGMVGSSFCATGNTTLTGCVNNGNLTGVYHKWGSKVGGMFGQIGAGDVSKTTFTLTDCVNNGKLTAAGKNAGGLIGEMNGQCKAIVIEDCRNHGEVIGEDETNGSYGGVFGFYFGVTNKSALTIRRTVNDAKVSGPIYVGGIFGSLKSPDKMTVESCVNLGDLTATKGYAGGLANIMVNNGVKAEGEMKVDGFLNAGSVLAAAESAGGLLGYAHAAEGGKVTLANTVNLGAVSAGEGKTAANFVAVTEGDGTVTLPTAENGYAGFAGLSDSSDKSLEDAVAFLNDGEMGAKIGKFELNEAKNAIHSTLSALSKGYTPAEPEKPNPEQPTDTDPESPTDTKAPTDNKAPSDNTGATSDTDAPADDKPSSGCSSNVTVSALAMILVAGAAAIVIGKKKHI